MKKLKTLAKILLFLPMMASTALYLASCVPVATDIPIPSPALFQTFVKNQGGITAATDLLQDVAQNMGQNSEILPDTQDFDINYIDTIYTDGDGIEIELDFGTTPVLCRDGWWRTGKFSVTSNEKRFSQVGAEARLVITNATMTKDNDAYVLAHSNQPYAIKVSRTGSVQSVSEYEFSMTYTDLAKNETNEYNAKGSYVMTQTAGVDLPGVNDDEFALSGTAEGEGMGGEKYTVNITQDLMRKGDPTCSKTFIRGKMEMKEDGKKDAMKLDFGDGTCDNEITIDLPVGDDVKYTL